LSVIATFPECQHLVVLPVGLIRKVLLFT